MPLRSAQWYAGDDRNAYIHRAWMRRGVPGDAFGRPQIAIANTASDLTPCNAHLTEVAAAGLQSVDRPIGVEHPGQVGVTEDGAAVRVDAEHRRPRTARTQHHQR